jgi:hypothetical protein
MEDFLDSIVQAPWYAPDTYEADTQVPDSLEDFEVDILAGESQPLEPLEDIEREVAATMAAYEEEEVEYEEEQGNHTEQRFGVVLDARGIAGGQGHT